MKCVARHLINFCTWPKSRTNLAVCAALIAFGAATADARSTASITPIPADASHLSSPAEGIARLDLTALAALATGKVVNFTVSDQRKPVPGHAFTDLAGQTSTIENYQGKVIVVNFWATWCAPCKRELPSLDRLQERVGGDDLAVLAISIDRRGADKVQPFLDKVPLPNLGVFLDQKNKLGRDMGMFGLPTTVLVDQRGREVGRLIGPAEWDSDESIALVRYIIDNGSRNMAQRVGTGTSPE
jgi:thiol-disulfide isomerase/thioredoxin